MVGHLADVITCAKFQDDILGVTILQGVEFPIFLLIFALALQQCSATALLAVMYPLVYYVGLVGIGVILLFFLNFCETPSLKYGPSNFVYEIEPCRNPL